MPILGSSASPKGVPTAPTIGTATAGDASASVTFSAPSFSKLPITSYTVTASPGGATGTGVSSPITVTGLTNGTSYTFTVTASHASGTSSASSASNSIVPVGYWIQAAGAIVYALGGDSSGNTYAFSTANGTLGASKQSSVPTFQWTYFGGAANPKSGCIYANSNGVIAGGLLQANGYSVSLVKMDGSGNRTWQKTLQNGYTGVGAAARISNVFLDASDNAYVSGSSYYDSSGNTYGFVSKYNSSGVRQWATRTSVAGSGLGYGVTADSSGNTYTLTYGNSQAVTKWDTSGNVVWSTYPASNTNGFTGSTVNNCHAINVDSSGNVFFCSLDSNNLYLNTWKLNSSGTVQWGRQLYIGSGGNVWAEPVMTMDSSGNVYIGVQSNQSVIAKYDTSGNLSWQRSLALGKNMYVYGLNVDANALYIGLWNVGGTPNGMVWKVPTDGSKTGTYTVSGTSFAYAASSFATANAASPTSPTSTMTKQTYGFTESAPSGTYTSYNTFLNGSGTTTVAI